MDNNSSEALKSGIWYTTANFLTKSIGIITTPIFTRLLSKSDVGAFGNYTSWLAVFIILITFNLESTFISAKFDFEKEFDSYVSTMFLFSGCSSIAWLIIFNLFSSLFVTKMHLDIVYINCMCMYLFFLPAVNLYQTKERYRFGYKKSVLISSLIAIGTALISVLLVVFMSNKLAGRVWGSAIPTIIIGCFLVILLFKAGNKIKVEYIRYALPICLPFIPHLLSMTFLNSLDKMMITDIRGEEENALYSIAYQCSSVVTILVTSLNTAYSPWLGEKLHEKAYTDIRTFSKKYVLIFLSLAVGIMLISPDIMMIMGGKSYMEAQYVMPPVMLGCVCQFIYTMYVNVEQYQKKTVGMAIASVSAAMLNYVLNYLLIPKYGYIAAAYTTLISFLWLFIIHMILVRTIGYSKVYANKYIIGIVGVASVITVLVNLLYRNTILRYSIVVLYCITLLFFIVKNKDIIMRLLKKKA
ncbi:oligosaccharide flippase family protein [Ruminococcus sp. HUN007]|uniref:lipopolysaccharide biosynthesis protein n=1 Tax=Ruminococcus sp. HUN007 TaxID=1514668 RepID=UPI0005D23A35|nr:oligosaccharide flippase family protein [Ruminococcus sp. HUN007]